jgi:hypothetical protein
VAPLREIKGGRVEIPLQPGGVLGDEQPMTSYHHAQQACQARLGARAQEVRAERKPDRRRLDSVNYHRHVVDSVGSRDGGDRRQRKWTASMAAGRSRTGVRGAASAPEPLPATGPAIDLEVYACGAESLSAGGREADRPVQRSSGHEVLSRSLHLASNTVGPTDGALASRLTRRLHPWHLPGGTRLRSRSGGQGCVPGHLPRDAIDAAARDRRVDMTEQIRGILWEHGRLPVDVEALNHQSDLYA